MRIAAALALLAGLAAGPCVGRPPGRAAAAIGSCRTQVCVCATEGQTHACVCPGHGHEAAPPAGALAFAGPCGEEEDGAPLSPRAIATLAIPRDPMPAPAMTFRGRDAISLLALAGHLPFPEPVPLAAS